MLYRKYRPQNFSEIVGQEHVVKTLQGALESGRVGHAYLFTGSRGTGKTSLARIFAKALNCADFSKMRESNFAEKSSVRRSLGEGGLPEPCNQCDSCLAASQGNLLDLIEIDAASNRGIDEIRNLKDSALVAAPSGGFKVFIIDEVHMLTKDAFNALLKILEEPPSHVVFILATTEPHKILPTVLSRVQRFDFKRLNQGQISGKLGMMARKEGIKINEEALKTIAMSADGALRDAEVALSKIQACLPVGEASTDSTKAISVDEVNEMLGLVSYRYYPEFVSYSEDLFIGSGFGKFHRPSCGIYEKNFNGQNKSSRSCLNQRHKRRRNKKHLGVRPEYRWPEIDKNNSKLLQRQKRDKTFSGTAIAIRVGSYRIMWNII